MSGHPGQGGKPSVPGVALPLLCAPPKLSDDFSGKMIIRPSFVRTMQAFRM